MISHLHFIYMSAVHIIFIYFIPFTGTMNSTNWRASNVWVFIAQLVEHCSANTEDMGSNPVEAPKTFFGLIAISITTAMITPSFHLYVRSSHNIHMFHSFHGYDEFNKLACSQRMGVHSSVGGALQR